MSRQTRLTSKKLIVVGIVLAIALIALYAPAMSRWVTWKDHYQSVDKWASTVKREPQKSQSFAVMQDGRWFTVHTSEVEISPDPQTGYATTYDGQQVQPIGFFVVPPGKWVNSASAIIPMWYTHRDWTIADHERQ